MKQSLNLFSLMREVVIYSEVILRMNAHGVVYGGIQYNISSNPELYFDMGAWAFFGVSVHTNEDGDAASITVYANGIAIGYDLPTVPEESFGR